MLLGYGLLEQLARDRVSFGCHPVLVQEGVAFYAAHLHNPSIALIVEDDRHSFFLHRNEEVCDVTVCEPVAQVRPYKRATRTLVQPRSRAAYRALTDSSRETPVTSKPLRLASG
jgi:hypothetical protein